MGAGQRLLELEGTLLGGLQPGEELVAMRVELACGQVVCDLLSEGFGQSPLERGDLLAQPLVLCAVVLQVRAQ